MAIGTDHILPTGMSPSGPEKRECLCRAAPFLSLPLATDGDKAQRDGDVLGTLEAAVEADSPVP